MAFNSSTIIIIIVVIFAFYLIYSQNKQNNNQPIYVSGLPSPQLSQLSQLPQLKQMPSGINDIPSDSSKSSSCQKCEQYKQILKHNAPATNITIENDTDPYSDPIKKQDLYSIYDHLTYPQMRLPREVLDKYNEYYEKNGSYPPFGQTTQPLFDNPILNGVLIKQMDDNEPFNDNIPSSVPLFRVKSSKNTNRFFYYIIDQRYLSKLELKIPLDHIKINGVRYNNADFYGLPELYDGDIIENIPIYPTAKFKIFLYKTYHFP